MTDIEVGTRGLVVGSGGQTAQFIAAEPIAVGDKVTLYNLKDNTRIAVPAMEFDIDNFVFIAPSFNFAGFNWKIDFNFDLIPLSPLFYGYKHHDFKCLTGGATFYGDSGISPSGGCKIMSRPRYGDIEYAFTDSDFENYPNPDDGSLCIKFLGDGCVEIWVVSAPYPDYGSGSPVAFYIFDKLVWSGIISPGYPDRVWYHIAEWSPV